ncbi:hypothetical protein SAMN04488029_1315 [Reichenbachiella faecimaris]|uniref:Uncharacterized protein n=1 Tax=Reichenbachiella faecimaris TaxID=692418 RepID=A0A1W2G8X7_REIFA|nr:hypothetical protein [Reichenbachiella faecimaris]SMD32954.1 hypothetical protein SAMN04488029_1315 [Reichenbachiella faecimaris]
MRPAAYFFSILILLTSACDDHDTSSGSCESTELSTHQTYADLVEAVPELVVNTFIEEPNAEGALGRNKNGYLHVRFQLPMTYLVEYAIRNQDEEVLNLFVLNLSYSFDHQTEAGDFEFVLPPDQPADQSSLAGNLLSGTAFFGYAVGISLVMLYESDWYQQLPEDHSAKLNIDGLNAKIALLLTFLKANIEELEQHDGMAPNRLLYDVLALYTLAGHVKDPEAVSLALPLTQQVFHSHQPEGYFLEAGGWDSSYNGVSVKLGFELFTLLNSPNHTDLRERLAEVITCAVNWQASRILETGEISTEGNSRVYPGGESLGGIEKRVDVEKTVRAFSYMAHLSGDASYGKLLDLVLNYYD